MIKDQLFKCLFIPFVGVAFPLLAQLLKTESQPLWLMVLTFLYFTGVTFLAWQGVVKLTARLRKQKPLQQTIANKLIYLSAAGAVTGAAFFFSASWVWQRTVLQESDGSALANITFCGAVGGLLLALLYEIIFLSVEKALDNRVLQQLERERVQAEVNLLKNEMDPHFFFNCMNTLSYLVRNDPGKAYEFVHKLSNVYKYFLRNKAKDFVPLQDEIEFLENYYYLLRIRFDDNIQLQHSIDQQNGPVYLLPCTLQVLVENAIKHNSFSEKEPLVVSIVLNGSFIMVSNPVKPKQQVSESTRIGLRNLEARYRLLTHQNIQIQKTNNRFLVKLPIVKQTNQHDKSSDN